MDAEKAKVEAAKLTADPGADTNAADKITDTPLPRSKDKLPIWENSGASWCAFAYNCVSVNLAKS